MLVRTPGFSESFPKIAQPKRKVFFTKLRQNGKFFRRFQNNFAFWHSFSYAAGRVNAKAMIRSESSCFFFFADFNSMLVLLIADDTTTISAPLTLNSECLILIFIPIFFNLRMI